MATRRIPYSKLAKAIMEGRQSRRQIAVRFRLVAHDQADSLKPLRAVLSRMRTKGYRNDKGELLYLK